MQSKSELSARISELGFRLNLSDHDEELAAALIQILTLHLEGIALEDIHGSDLVDKADLALPVCPVPGGNRAMT